MLDKYIIQVIILLLFVVYLNSSNTEKQTIIILSLTLVGFFYFINNNNKETFTDNKCGNSGYASYSDLQNNNIFDKAKQNWDNFRKRNNRILYRRSNRFGNNANQYLINKKNKQPSCNSNSVEKTNSTEKTNEQQCSNRNEIEKKIDELKYMLNNTCF